MYMRVHKCGLIGVVSVFFKEPTEVHFIKEVSRKINLAPTSVRNHIIELKKTGFIVEKKALPFSGLVANRESREFIFYKRLYNIHSLKEVIDLIRQEHYPALMLLFGSYSRGEDIETSDIDILILTKNKKSIDLKRFEKELGRKINLLVLDNSNKIDKGVLKNMKGGIVLLGSWE